MLCSKRICFRAIIQKRSFEPSSIPATFAVMLQRRQTFSLHLKRIAWILWKRYRRWSSTPDRPKLEKTGEKMLCLRCESLSECGSVGDVGTTPKPISYITATPVRSPSGDSVVVPMVDGLLLVF